MELDPFSILIAFCLSLRDPLCKALHHSRFAHTRRANEAGVVPWVTRLEIIISGFNMNWKYLEISNHELEISGNKQSNHYRISFFARSL
jgi:hypothetical protein